MSILFGSPGRNVVTDKNRNLKNLKEQQTRRKVAEENGDEYMCSLKANDVLSNGQNARSKTPMYPGDVVVLDVSNKRLSDISNIELCERLVVCNLSNNFLKDVSSLKWCVNLYCLDLHSNQVSTLVFHIEIYHDVKDCLQIMGKFAWLKNWLMRKKRQ